MSKLETICDKKISILSVVIDLSRKQKSLGGLCNMKKTPQQCIAGNLKYLRQYYGYTQWQLAELMHIGRSTYTAMELGNKIPRVDLLVKLAEIYHINIDTLFETNTRKFIREITLANANSQQIIEFVDLYHKLSPFSQGCLFEKASELLLKEKEKGR